MRAWSTFDPNTPRCVLVLAVGLMLTVTTTVVHAQQSDPQAPSEVSQSSQGNTVQAARLLFHEGIRDLERAEGLADKAASSDDPGKAEKLLAKSLAANESAIEHLTRSLQTDPANIDGYAGLGLAYRHLGKYQEALEIHAIALRRDPDSMENFRGWSEALMNLQMLGNATQAYTSYVETDSPRAPILMEEIKRWLAAKQADPGEIDPAHIERLAAWVAEQEQGG